MPMYNALVIDTQPIVREALEGLIRDSIGQAQVFHAKSMNFAVQLLKNHNIDLVILDIELDNSDGFEFVRRAKAHGYKGKVLFISSIDHPMYSDTAFKLGANGYISKGEETLVLKEAIISVSRGYTVFKMTENNAEKAVKLSNRETVVFNYLVKGHSNKQISELLSLSSKTISTYKSRILDKYNVRTIVELMRIQDNIISDTVCA